MMTVSVSFEGANLSEVCAQINAFLRTLPTAPTVPGSIPPATVPTDTPAATGYALDWDNPKRLILPMRADDVLIIKMTTGNKDTGPSNLAKLTAAEYVSSPSAREACLSLIPGDFDHPVGALKGSGNTVTFPFSVGPNNTGYYPALAQNTTYYLNIRNAPNCSCRANGVCDMYCDLTHP
jgi:hypothetical protein